MKRILFILIFTLSFSYAETLKIAVGLSIPPYVIKESDSGFEIELVREVLWKKQHFIKGFVYASNERLTKLLKDKKVDAVINIQPNLKGIYYSDAIAYFKNKAITLKRRDIHIDSMIDLHYKRVLGFQNASKFLGKEFADYANENPLYDETIHQSSQVKNLVMWRVDVVIADERIFMYYYNQLYGNSSLHEFNFFNVFPRSPRYVGFLNSKIRDDFDVALEEYKTSPEYYLLLDKYGFRDELERFLNHLPHDK